MRGRLLVVLLAVSTVVMVIHHYWFRVSWLPGYAGEPCLYAEEGFCGTLERNKPVDSLVLWAGVLVVVVLLSRPVARWVMAPARNLIPLVTQIGPQNLGLRIPPRSRFRSSDEVAALVTALNGMLDRLAAGYEGQRTFAANASHELRTPLALQRMIIEVAMTEPLAADQSAQVAGQLLQANERSERIIEGLLTLSQAEQGIVAHTPQRLDEITAEVAAEHGVAFAPLAPHVVDGDRVLLERLLRNLIHNAVKYNVPGGSVHVVLTAEGALSVTNTGPVVAASDVARLFEPFTRLNGDRIDHTGGSGLGLAIARAIVRSHRGTLDAIPNPGGGLRVTVRLPPSSSR